MLRTRGVAVTAEPVTLAGAHAAVSARTVRFSATQPQVAFIRLMVGIALAVPGPRASMAPERSRDLDSVVPLPGARLILSP